MDNSEQRTFGRNVRQLRETLGLSQESLAAAAGLDRSYVGGIERGERNPSLSAIINLALALGVAPARLFTGIGEDESAVPQLPVGIMATEAPDGLTIRFKYDRYDAEYFLSGATLVQYDEVIGVSKIR